MVGLAYVLRFGSRWLYGYSSSSSCFIIIPCNLVFD